MSATLEQVPADRARVLAAIGRLAPIRDEYPFQPNFHAVPSGLMHYVDEGPRDADPIVCVHGNPTWSFAFRRIVKAFSKTHRVIALDHIGCGLSDKPQDYEYTLARHAENLTSLVRALDLERITLVMHDWGGAIGMAFARREPQRVARLFAMNTAAFRSKRMPLRIRACRMPVVGPWLVRDLNLFAGVTPWMAVENRKLFPFPAQRGMLLPYESKSARVAIGAFVEDIPLTPAHRSYAELVATEEALAWFAHLPAALCWGERDWCFTKHFRLEWERRFPRAAVTKCERAGHYVFEEAPADVEHALAALLSAQP